MSDSKTSGPIRTGDVELDRALKNLAGEDRERVVKAIAKYLWDQERGSSRIDKLRNLTRS